MGLTKAEREAMRPTNCPFHDTMKICGKAYRSGCRNELCVEGKQVEKGRKADAAKSKTKVSPAKARMLELQKAFSARDESHSPEWIKHGTCCGGVWRRKEWGCIDVNRGRRVVAP